MKESYVKLSSNTTSPLVLHNLIGRGQPVKGRGLVIWYMAQAAKSLCSNELGGGLGLGLDTVSGSRFG
jgi:hypothetical protein